MPFQNLTEIEKKISSNIKRARITNNYSQAEIGKVLDVTYQQIQKYESGFNRISAGSLFLLSKFLKKPINYFYEQPLIPSNDGQEKDELELLKMFQLIKNPHLRKKVIGLCEILKDDCINRK